MTCDTWGAHSGAAEDGSVLRYDAVSLDSTAFIFRVKPSFLGLFHPDDGGSIVFRNVGKYSFDDRRHITEDLNLY